jgi:hypothetical protein
LWLWYKIDINVTFVNLLGFVMVFSTIISGKNKLNKVKIILLKAAPKLIKVPDHPPDPTPHLHPLPPNPTPNPNQQQLMNLPITKDNLHDFALHKLEAFSVLAE